MTARVDSLCRALRSLAALLPRASGAGLLPGHPFRTLSTSVFTAAADRSHDPPAATETWPVVVAGGGPTGLTAALLLSSYGVRCLLLERSHRLTDHPQAHFINHRTMEVFRGVEGLAAEVAGMMPPLQQWRSFVYCTSMTGGVLGTVDHFKGQQTPHSPAISPEPVAHLSQHCLLPLLARRAAERSNLDLRMGHRLVDFQQPPPSEGAASGCGGGASSGGVELTVAPPGGGQRYCINAQYLVAADGAHSAVRGRLGIPMQGPGAMQHLVNIHFVSHQLGAALAGREGMLYFVFNAGVIAVVVAHNIEAGEFVAQVPYFPPLQTAEEFTPAVCADLVRHAAGRASLQLDVRQVRPWTMSAAVAAAFGAGAVLLAGDAAHVVPPSGAFGMNTGVQDAHNLAWKVAAVVQGAAPPALLQTYQAERKPVAEANMRLSVANFYEALRVPQIMGLDFRTANAVSNALSSEALAWAPSALRRGMLDAAVVTGRAASGPISALRRAELEALFQRGETLRLQYPKEDVGFVYGHDGAVYLADGVDRAAVCAYASLKRRGEPFEPAALPGTRLPHFWIKVLRSGALSLPQGAPHPASSIDLAAAAGLQLVLLVSPSAALQQWVDAADEVNASGGGMHVCPVVVVQQEGQAAGAPDGVGVVLDVSGSWGALLGVGVEGALLVRPDGHVAWRCRAAADTGTTLAHAAAAVVKAAEPEAAL